MTDKIDNKSFWKTIKKDLKGMFPDDVYKTWFEGLEVCAEEGNDLVLGVGNDFAAIWLQDNYHDLIEKRVQMTMGPSIKVHYRVSEGGKSEGPVEVVKKVTAPTSTSKKRNKASADGFPRLNALLNPKNTFENFVVGAGNQLAHAASIAVANSPAKAYNPLFLYGDTGLGKTHLMHAVAHTVLKSNEDAKVAYVSTEKFTNEFIHAIQNNTLTKFRKRYRDVDVLLVDDIHFLSGKERIQEEFFHTFNELFESQKQILLCSDRPAGEIAKLESRLISRFQWGLVTDIQAPDLETRVAILSKKATAMKLDLPDNVINFLAERVSRNVRRMEGALTRVAGYAALVNGRVDVASVEKLLKDILQEEAQNQISVEQIKQKVTDHYQLRLSDMVSKRRPANIAFPRQIAMYLSRTLTNCSLQEIGESFGGRDHGTVIHACKSVENMLDQDETVRRNVEYLHTQITSQR